MGRHFRFWVYYLTFPHAITVTKLMFFGYNFCRSRTLSTGLSSIVAILELLPTWISRILVKNSVGNSWCPSAVEALCTHVLRVRFNFLWFLLLPLVIKSEVLDQPVTYCFGLMWDESYLSSWSVSQLFPKMRSQSSHKNNYEKPNHVNFDGKQTKKCPFSPFKAIKVEMTLCRQTWLNPNFYKNNYTSISD